MLNLFLCRSEQRIALPVRPVVLRLVYIAKLWHMMELAQQMNQGRALSTSRMSKVGNPFADAVKWYFAMRAVTT